MTPFERMGRAILGRAANLHKYDMRPAREREESGKLKVLAIAVARRLGLNRKGKLRVSIVAIWRGPAMSPLRRAWAAVAALPPAFDKLASALALEVQRNRQLRNVAGAWKVGPLIIGRAPDVDALSRGESIIPVAQDGRRHSVVRCGPVAIAHVGDFDRLVRPLIAFDEEVRESRAAGRRANLPGYGPRRNGRSVMFLHHCYYNFFYMAAALRKRGWDALSVSIENPDSHQYKFYHGEDVNLFDPDPELYRRKLVALYSEVETRFRMVHFHAAGCMSMFPAHFDTKRTFDALPVDFLRLRQRGIKIGYTVSGCNDGVAQSSINKWSGACNRCVWQDQPEVCADAGNLAWGRKVHTMCDVVDTGGAPALDWKSNPDTVFRDALTMALDPELWRPDLEIPEKYRLQRSPGELIVYHAVGNYELRSRNNRNIKGTGAIMAAIDRLKSEGFRVRLEFVTDVPSKDVRFIQVQADIMIDQLNYGRHGAQACEGMMLGRPVICYMKKDELPGISRVPFVEECPIVSATEQSIYDVLKDLLLDENRRRELAKASRDFAMKWHSADSCAERFEVMYDRLMNGERPSLTGLGIERPHFAN